MTKYKIVLDRKGCIGAFSCATVGNGGDIWEMSEAEGKVDLKLKGATKTPEHHEIIGGIRFRICGLKPSHDSGVDVCPPCAPSTSNKIA